MRTLAIDTTAVVRRIVADYIEANPPYKTGTYKAHAARGRLLGATEMVALIFRLRTPFAVEMDIRNAALALGERPAYESSRNAAQKDYDAKWAAALHDKWAS